MSSAVKKESPENSSLNFVQNCFYVLFFITPLLLWPFTSEVFEFNKMLFVYAMTIIIAAGWAVRSLQQKKFEIVRTPLDIPILLFLTSQILSTIFSIDRHTSLWGYYSRFHGGLASTISYTFLFYALITHFHGQTKAIKKLITAILATATITSIYAVLEKMGVDKDVWVQDVQNRVFSTLGQPNWLSAYLIALLPLSLFTMVNTKNLNTRLLHIFLSLMYLTAILFTRSQSGIGATVVVLIAFVIMVSMQKKKPVLFLGLLIFLLAGFLIKGDAIKRTIGSLNKINPFYSDSLTIITEENKTRIGGSDSMAIRRVVWTGAIELGKRYPFFGTGVETFGYSYYWVRPVEHNLTSEMDFLYNKAHNEYLNFLATTGFFGLFSYLLLIGSILYLFIKNKDGDLRSPLLLGFVSILITNYFGFSVVNIGLFFFLFPAIFLSQINKTKSVSTTVNFDKNIGIIIVLIVALWLLLGVRKTWVADLSYSAGRANLDKNLQAVKLRPTEPMYYAQLGNVQALVAVQIIAPQIKDMDASTPAELKAKAQGYLDQYISNAIANTTKAVSMNKYNINLLKTKARTELTLSTIDPKYSYEALQSLLKVTELSPNEATNFYNIGILYKSLGKVEEAGLAFQKAVDLKSDYQAAKDNLNLLIKD